MELEKIPAACAMEWSIHLEKSLRSKIPGKSIEAILEIGPKLEQWNNESNLTMAEYKIFNLISHEDKLFLNAIFLRLADTFISGDKPIKICIVKIFLSLRKKVGDEEGILCKDKLVNYEELLKRVKIVFDNGDIEEKALALGLYGCWANIAKDSAYIRYLLLSSLVSTNILEVKASLFASGCFSEISEDFAFVFLEILLNVLISSESSSVKLVAGQAFAKLRNTFSLANKAYKTGLKLTLESLDEDFASVMLISLSKIASKWTLLIPGQMDIILLFLSKKTSLKLQFISLKCLHIILARGVCLLPLSKEAVQNLLNVINESESSLILRCEALKILNKIFQGYIPEMEVSHVISELFRGVKDIIQSSVMSQRLFAFRVLFNISKNLAKVSNGELNGFNFARLILFVTDHISLLFESNMNILHSNTEVKLEFKSLISLLINLVKENSDLTNLILDKILLFTENLVKILERNEHKLEISILSDIMICLSKLVITCLEDLSNEVSFKALNMLKSLVNVICECSFFNVYTHTIYLLLLHSFMNINERHDFEHEIVAIEYTKKVLGKKLNWFSYKIGKYAACKGLWSVASIIFAELVPMVKSECLNLWLKTLVNISDSEKQIQLLGRLNDKEEVNFVKTLQEARNFYLISVQTLTARNFYFQTWFLTLRAKVLETVANLIDLIQVEKSKKICSLVHPFTQVSNKFKNLALEFDLMGISFIEMDLKSRKIISVFALSCSLLAFSVGFSCLIPNLNATESTETCNLLIQDLIKRLCYLDDETCIDLRKVLMDFQRGERFYSSKQISKTKGIDKLCKYVVTEILSLRNKGGEDKFQMYKDGLDILLNIILIWMKIPFQIPNHFFRFRPFMSCEIYVMNEEGLNMDGISVISGFNLPLNICLQLRNIPTDLTVEMVKFYCILSCERLCKDEDLRGEEMVDLHVKLKEHVTGLNKVSNKRNKFVSFEANKSGQGFSTCLLDISNYGVGFYRIKWLCCFIDSKGLYWNLVPINSGPVFSVEQSNY